MIQKELRMWDAKLLHNKIQRYNKQIVRFESMIKKIKGWIRADKKKLNKLIRKMSPEEQKKFGLDVGLITDEDIIEK